MKTLPPNPHRVALIPELPPRGGRLGRHVQFDERSRNFGVLLVARKTTPLVSRTWHRGTAALNQSDTGSCVGNSVVGVLATAPYHVPYHRYTEKLARSVYSMATKLDAIQGEWPPNDTGSSVLAGMKAAVAMKLARSYRWCFGLDDALQTLSTIGPIAVGVNWYEGFDNTDVDGRVSISGRVRGGHAFEILALDTAKRTVTAVNSWGQYWGVRGRFTFSWADFDRLLSEDGEAGTITV